MVVRQRQLAVVATVAVETQFLVVEWNDGRLGIPRSTDMGSASIHSSIRPFAHPSRPYLSLSSGRGTRKKKNRA